MADYKLRGPAGCHVPRFSTVEPNIAAAMSTQTRPRPSFNTCTEVSLYCPVRATTLGYYPNEGLNIFLAIGYGLAAIVTLVFGVWKRTWGFSIAVGAGCLLECVGTFS